MPPVQPGHGHPAHWYPEHGEALLLRAQGERHSGRNLCSPYFVNEGEYVPLVVAVMLQMKLLSLSF